MFRKLSMEELDRKSAEDVKQASKIPVVVILDNVRSMNNVGSVFRTSDAFLIESIYLCGYTPCPPHRDIHKTALGATETVKWEYEQNILELLDKLQSQGYMLLAVEQTTESTFLDQFQWDGIQPLALILGNEVEGVQDEVLAKCNGCLEIPQLGMKHSLNIAVATGMVLWEVFSQYRIRQSSNGQSLPLQHGNR